MTAPYRLPDLPYDEAALEPHLSARIMALHHGVHHRAYVDGANAVNEALVAARGTAPAHVLVGLEKSLAFHVSGHVLHSLYWNNLSPDGGGEPTGALAEAIGEQFGDVATFWTYFSAVTVGVQGSGWGVLSWDPTGRRLLVEQVEVHQHNTVQASIPLLVIDAWEHAYYLQYENRRADYMRAMGEIIAWDVVEQRFQTASASPAR